MLPFRRVAIFEPSLVFPRPLAALSQREVVAFTADWCRKVSQHGADACYLRLHVEVPFLNHLLACLDAEGPAQLLLSSHLAAYSKAHHGLHFQSRAAAISSPLGLRGRSCHSLAALQAAFAEGMDYAFFSPIFATATHPEAEPVGLEALRAACSSLVMPIFALGGIDAERSAACLEAGAYGVAGIRMFLG